MDGCCQRTQDETTKKIVAWLREKQESSPKALVDVIMAEAPDLASLTPMFESLVRRTLRLHTDYIEMGDWDVDQQT